MHLPHPDWGRGGGEGFLEGVVPSLRLKEGLRVAQAGMGSSMFQVIEYDVQRPT